MDETKFRIWLEERYAQLCREQHEHCDGEVKVDTLDKEFEILGRQLEINLLRTMMKYHRFD